MKTLLFLPPSLYLNIIGERLTRDDSSWRHQPPGVPSASGGPASGLQDSFVSASLTLLPNPRRFTSGRILLAPSTTCSSGFTTALELSNGPRDAQIREERIHNPNSNQRSMSREFLFFFLGPGFTNLSGELSSSL